MSRQTVSKLLRVLKQWFFHTITFKSEVIMSNEAKALAYSNNDVALASWFYPEKIQGCLGFAIYRVNVSTEERTPLPAWVGFRGESNKEWSARTTEVWPVQKFVWRDFTAARGSTYYYEIVPMIGHPGDLRARTDLRRTTNQVQLTPKRGSYSVFFNRGILATQHLAHAIPSGPSGKPNYRVLTERIDQPGDPLRNSLAGQSIDALKSLLKRAQSEGGDCYCALYELNDPELLQLLIGAPHVHLILANAGTDDSTNQAARQALHESDTPVIDNFFSSGHIGHNKFIVYVDKKGTARAVLTGSTNWTYTGLCAQTNNAILIESTDVASLYLKYWNKLKDDEAEQSVDFRDDNNEVRKALVDRNDVHIWFSPNTRRKTKPSKNPPTPSDMQEVFDVMKGAEQAILFLLFQPGKPSVLDQAAACQKAKKGLFVRGAVTDPKAVKDFDVDLYHRSGLKPDGTVVAAAAVNDQFSFWQEELLKASPSAHAIIHDKIVVVDPLSENCAVITGSHNLGYRASYNNTENLLVIKGDTEVAKAYAVHVMDVYDHYRWRYLLQDKKRNAWTGLEPSDRWQNKYFQKNSDAMREMKFWCGLDGNP